MDARESRGLALEARDSRAEESRGVVVLGDAGLTHTWVECLPPDQRGFSTFVILGDLPTAAAAVGARPGGGCPGGGCPGGGGPEGGGPGGGGPGGGGRGACSEDDALRDENVEAPPSSPPRAVRHAYSPARCHRSRAMFPRAADGGGGPGGGCV
uniref:Uncharacterized protein n=1 Tax=Haptolina ericina TaxID=156174 RepID=A0A7S3BPV4_9EUKA|mmetsp:Transcript_63222/g.140893  ORF Transcript_63222/g.140893 Transcript_63222/m.140893 type:complete len:154 (+) Transcript_63222:2172-2633(+)